ncbi:MAG: hypothetical protein K2X47_19720 [Bdellovibrionales bacterium]|nr:hypothetical protein [Bdellovibrionales bacterium]
MARTLKILFGTLFVIFGVGVSLGALRDLVPVWTETPDQILNSLVRQDLEQMVAKKTLSDAFFDLKTLEIKNLSKDVEGWLTPASFPFVMKGDGKNRLSVQVDLWKSPETGQNGVLVQMQIYDIASQNLVWELGRTYIIQEYERSEFAGK